MTMGCRRELQHLLLHPLQLFMPKIFVLERFRLAILMIMALLVILGFIFSLGLFRSKGWYPPGGTLD